MPPRRRGPSAQQNAGDQPGQGSKKETVASPNHIAPMGASVVSCTDGSATSSETERGPTEAMRPAADSKDIATALQRVTTQPSPTAYRDRPLRCSLARPTRSVPLSCTPGFFATQLSREHAGRSGVRHEPLVDPVARPRERRILGRCDDDVHRGNDNLPSAPGRINHAGDSPR